MANQGGPNMEQFENYFKRADLDGDGKISGNEAVAFFQGSNLPKTVLAQIWMHADQARTGFLGRAEFFNALRLVTVAQSKRELTPEIVKAALYGPAAAKIPPPQINLPSTPAPQSNYSTSAATSAVMRPAAPMPSQNVGFRGQAPMGNNQQYFSSQQSQTARPPQSLSSSSSFQPQQANTGPRGASMTGPSIPSTNDWIGGSGAMVGPRGVNQPTASAPATQQSPTSLVALPSPSDSKALGFSGNGSASAPAFGGDLFSANTPPPKQSPLLGYSASSTTVSAPASVGPQSSVKPNLLDSLQSTFSMQPASSQVQHPQTPQTPVSSQGPSSFSLTGALAGTANSSPNNSQIPWPKMKASDVQKYTKVFMEVDTDRDGKITGEQARNLFLSWRLPREVLKQVWDLSDQDNDSMLSLREFCFALYLMERYREGRPLPAALPSNVMYDETLLSMTGVSNPTYGNSAWAPSSGFRPQGMPGARPVGPATGVRPVMQGPVPPTNSANQNNQQDLQASAQGDSFVNLVDHADSNLASSNVGEASAAEKKVEEKVILDSREKLEFYRTKMQDLVLYKRRCDNRLNEIIERASADKREAESLGKKYEEKYKQVAEIASKLTVEEAAFREIQERKSELQQAIVKMEQGGSADGILQVRADRIQSHLDELIKALTDRCKKHGLDVKSKALIVLPTGWEPGIPELAAIWDEDWDKFEDEGFSTEVTVDGKNITTSSTSVYKENASPDNGFAYDSPLSADGKVLHSPSTVEHAFDSESAYAHSEDEAGRSPRGSPVGRTAGESPSNIFSDTHFDKNSEADPDLHGSFDDSNWGAFDNDDVDSVWGFNTKDPDSSFNQRDSFSSDFGVNPIRTSSSQFDNSFQKRTSFFDESVPATPMSNFGNSSPRYSEAGDHYFDNNFSRFDSFRTNDSGFYAQPEKLARFDSISSGKDFAHSRAFSSFDDSDPFGSSGPFKVSSDSQTPKKSSDNWNAF